MITLESLQYDFKRYLLDDDRTVAAWVTDTAHLDANSRLQIYASAYRARLAEALSADYPAVRATLGEAPFAEVSAAYIAAHPSGSFTLRGFGARLAAFLEQCAELPDREARSELATFEWAFVDAFDSPDRNPATVEAMAAIAPEAWPGLRIIAHASVQVVATRFNTLRVWSAAKANENIPRPATLPEPAGCFVWRQGLATVFRSVEPDELIAWRALALGNDFSQACDALLARVAPENVPLRAATLLRNWLAEGLIGKLDAP